MAVWTPRPFSAPVTARDAVAPLAWNWLSAGSTFPQRHQMPHGSPDRGRRSVGGMATRGGKAARRIALKAVIQAEMDARPDPDYSVAHHAQQ
jgi:hypothetical protein